MELVTTAARRIHGGGIVLGGVPDADGVPLLADRPLVDGSAAAYVCRGYLCEQSVTAPSDLAHSRHPSRSSSSIRVRR